MQNTTDGGADYELFDLSATRFLNLKSDVLLDYEDDSELEVIVSVTSGASGNTDRDKTSKLTVTLTITDVDCAGDDTTGCELELGVPQIEDIGTTAETDWLEVTLDAGTGYRVDVAGADATPVGGSLTDPAVALFDGDGDAVTFSGANVADSDSDSDGIASFTYTPGTSEGGTYYIAVSEDGDDDIGTYTVTVSELSDTPPRITNSVTALTVNENTAFSLQITAVDDDAGHSITGYALYPDGDRASFTITDVDDTTPGVLTLNFTPDFENPRDENTDNEFDIGVTVTGGVSGSTLSTTQRFTIEVIDVDEPPDLPTNVRVTSIGLDSLEFKWDKPSNAGRPGPLTTEWRYRAMGEASWTPATTGGSSGTATALDAATEYEMQARAKNPEGESAWTMAISEWTQDCAKTTATTCSVTVGADTEGLISPKIGSMVDADWFEVTLTAGAEYQIDVKGNVAGDVGGTLPDPRMWMRDAAGNRITNENDDNSGTGNNALLMFTPTTTGTHYIEVRSGNDAEDGTYTVAVQLLEDENLSPSITNASLRHELVEHTALSLTVTATDDDTEDSITGFSISGGADAAYFAINNSGVLTMASGGNPYLPDFERPVDVAGSGATAGDNEYQVQVTATSGAADRARSVNAVFTIVVTDVDEQPDKPVLRLTGVTLDSAEVAWDKPATLGPDISDYTMRREAGGTTVESTVPFDALSRLAESLDKATTYRFSLRANSAELNSAWSDDLVVTTDDCGDADSTADACSVSVGGSASGRIDKVLTGDHDWFEVSLEAGVEYRITVEGGSGSGELADPSVALFDSTGNAVMVAGSALADSDGTDPGDSDDTAAVIFTPAADAVFYVEVSETGDDATGTYEVTVEAVNAPPVFDEGASHTVSVSEFATLSHTVGASDVDTGDAIVFSIVASTSGGGADFADFEIDAATGELSFAAGVDPDHEAASSYAVIVTVTSGTGGRARTITQAITVTVANVECTDTTSTACELVLDHDEVENLAAGADVHWLAIEVEHHQEYEIAVSGSGATPSGGTLADPEVAVYDSSGNALTAGDPPVAVTDADADSDGVAEIAFTPSADGTYYIAVSSAGGSGTGTYTVSAEAHVSVVPQVPQNLRVTRSAFDTLAFAWDVPLDAGTLALTYALQYRTDSGSSWQPVTPGADRTATVTGLAKDTSYEVQVRATNAAGDGPWTATLEAWTDDCASAITDSCTLTAGTASAGRISSVGADSPDADWFSIDLVLGTTYQIDVKGSETSDTGGTLDDPAVNIFDSYGRELPYWSVTDGGAGDNARLMFTANATDTFYVEVTENGADATGTYEVTIAELSPDVKLTEVTLGSLTLNWPTQLVTHTVEQREPPASTWTTVNLTLPAGVNQRVIPGLSVGTTYEFRVTPASDNPYDTLRFTMPECAATTHTICEVEIDGSLSAELEHASDVDWFKLSLEADTLYRIDAERDTGVGGLDDVFIELYNADGTVVSPAVKDGDDGTDNDASVEFTPSAAGDWFVAVSHPADTGTGSYTVSLVDLTPKTVSEAGDVDFPADNTTEGHLLVDEVARGNVATGGDHDWFGVTLEPGTPYSIYLSGLPGDSSSLDNPRIRGIYNADGTQVSGTGNNDGGSGNDAHVVFEHHESTATEFFISARGSGQATGKYQLWLTRQQPGVDVDESELLGSDAPSHAGTRAHIIPDSEVEGDLLGGLSAVDVDFYGVVLKPDRLYAIEVRGDCTSDLALDGGSLANPTLRLGTANDFKAPFGILHLDPANSQDASQFVGVSSGDCNNKRMEIAVQAAGVHYIEVSAGSNISGSYTLLVSELDDPVAVEAGETHACALWGSGDVQCWGNDADGRSTPPSGVQFAQISVGSYANCGVALDGTIDCWGGDRSGHTTPPAGTDFVQVVVGEEHSCALKADGTAQCWGKSLSNRLNVPQGATFTSLSAGRDITCGVLTDALPACWGLTSDGNTSPPSTGKYVEVAAGDRHGCAIKSNRTVECWGLSEDNRLNAPTGNFISIDSVADFTCGIDDGFDIHCWGQDNSDDRVSNAPTSGTWLDVSAGFDHACALSADLTVTCWGDNDNLQSEPPLALVDDVCAGDASTQCMLTAGEFFNGAIDAQGDIDWVAVELRPDTAYKVYLGTQGAPNPKAGATKIKGVYQANSTVIGATSDTDSGSGDDALVVFETGGMAAATFYVAVEHDGGVIGSYNLAVSKLRPGSDESEPNGGDLPSHAGSPGFVTLGGEATGNIANGSDADAFGVSMIAGRSYRIDVRGECASDTDEDGGTLADVTAELHRADGSRDFTDIAEHRNAVDSQASSQFHDDDSGSCDNARLEIAAEVNGVHYVSVEGASGDTGTYTVAVTDTTIRETVALSAGFDYSCALIRDGEVICWGRSADGRTNPTSGVEFAQIGLGPDAACGTDVSGGVHCWGTDTEGNVDDAPTEGSFVWAGAGAKHGCALQSNGTVLCWGNEDNGRATPPTDTSSDPVEFSSIAVGSHHSCGVVTDGSLACWGANGHGRATPPTSGSFTKVTAGTTHSCAIKSNRSIECWGNSAGDRINEPSGNFTAIDSTDKFTCGVKANGSISCWGVDDGSAVSDAPSSGTFLDVSAGQDFACALTNERLVECWGNNANNRATPPATLPISNMAPTFTSDAMVSVAEYTTLSHTVVATELNPEDDVVYSVTGGADQSSFTIDPSSGVLTQAAGVVFDFDDNRSYTVVVTATGGTGVRELTAEQTITVTVTDASTVPPAPTLSLGLAADVLVRLEWSVAAFAGPDVSTFTVEWRLDGASTWPTSNRLSVTATDPLSGEGEVTGLSAETDYEFRVSATNSEGTSGWSAVLDVTTPDATNHPPVFTSPATFEVNEHTQVNHTVVATDLNPQDALSYAVTGGADQSDFAINASTGVLRLATGAELNFEVQEEHEVVVTATSGTGGRARTAVQTITVKVKDVEEQAPTPDTPTTANAWGDTWVLIWWTADLASYKGPDITQVCARYREKDSSAQHSEHCELFAPMGAEADDRGGIKVTGLDPATEYEFEIGLINGELPGQYSGKLFWTTRFADDCTDDVMTTCTVALRARTFGIANVNTERDWFKVELEADVSYAVFVDGLAFSDDDGNSFLPANVSFNGIYDSTGTKVTGLGSTNKGYLEFSVGTDGTYFVSVQSGDADLTGYEIWFAERRPTASVSEAAGFDLPTNGATYGHVVVGSTATGDLDDEYDVDDFGVVLEEDKYYLLEAKGQCFQDDGGTNSNPAVSLYTAILERPSNSQAVRPDGTVDGLGRTDWSDDDSGACSNALMKIQAKKDAVFLVRVWSTADTIGTYTVAVTEVPAPALVISDSSLDMDEGDTDSYTVGLASRPTDTVTVTLTADDGITLSNTTRTFTTSNWETAQTVTVTADSDDDAADVEAVITHTASGAGYGDVTGTVTVNVDDDEDAGVNVSKTQLTLGESSTDSYTVKLDTPPTTDVEVRVTRTGQGATVSPARLKFTPSNWSTAQIVTVTGSADTDGDDHTLTLSHRSIGGEYHGVEVNDVTAEVSDDDAREVVVDTGSADHSLDVDEGMSAGYTLKLSTRPTSTVTVTVSPASGVAVSPATLQFTRLNWDTAQQVTVTAGFDGDADDSTATIAHTVVGGGYDGVTVEEVEASIDDTGAVGVQLVPTTVAMDEGSSAHYSVVLASAPTGTVTITPTVSGNSDVTVAPASFEFTSANWDVPQTATVTAAADTDTAADSATITHAISGGGYGSVAVADVTVSIGDDADKGVTVSASSLSISEGSKADYTVKLDSQPTSTVTVTMSVQGDAGIEVMPATLTFTTTDWETAQTVEVSAPSDEDAAGEVAAIAHAASGGGYDSVIAPTVAVSIPDGVAPPAIAELFAGDESFTVQLSPPAALPGDTSLERYDIRYRRTGSWTTVDAGTSVGPHVIDGLSGSTNVEFEVQARTVLAGGTTSPWSDSQKARIGQPLDIVDLTVATSSGALHILWSPPNNAEQLTANGKRVRYFVKIFGPDDAETNFGWYTWEPRMVRYVTTPGVPLANGTQYDVHVKTSLWSADGQNIVVDGTTSTTTATPEAIDVPDGDGRHDLLQDTIEHALRNMEATADAELTVWLRQAWDWVAEQAEAESVFPGTTDWYLYDVSAVDTTLFLGQTWTLCSNHNIDPHRTGLPTCFSPNVQVQLALMCGAESEPARYLDCLTSASAAGVDPEVLAGSLLLQSLIAHELMHVYLNSIKTMTSDVGEPPAPMGVALLHSLANDRTHWTESDVICADELIADHAALIVTGIIEGGYQTSCLGIPAGTQVTCAHQALSERCDVLKAAVKGDVHQWFSDTYAGDSAKVWADIVEYTTVDGSRVANVGHVNKKTLLWGLSELFGGYCSPRVANDAMFSATTEIFNPWVDGGCEPASPESVMVIEGDNANEFTVFWDAVLDEGGADLSGYDVQWRRSGETYNDTRSASVAATDNLAMIDVGPGTGDVFIRVVARNEIGSSSGGETTCTYDVDKWNCLFEEPEGRTPRDADAVRRWPGAKGPYKVAE